MKKTRLITEMMLTCVSSIKGSFKNICVLVLVGEPHTGVSNRINYAPNSVAKSDDSHRLDRIESSLISLFTPGPFPTLSICIKMFVVCFLLPLLVGIW